MSTTAFIILIITIIVIIFILYKVIKPYTIKYDNALLLSGAVGSGKTLSGYGLVKHLYKRIYIKVYLIGNLKIKIKNLFIKDKKKKLKRIKKPRVYANIPMRFKPTIFSKWVNAYMITPEMLTLHKGIREFSVVFLDELPQLVNQFNWNIDLVQNNVNEFATFFRHYIGGYLIMTAQSNTEIVKQIRTKLGQYIMCKNFAPHFFKTFYTLEMTTMLCSEDTININQTQIEENTKRKFGILLGLSKCYNTRCFKQRYIDNILEKDSINDAQWNANETLYTNNIIRFKAIKSPLDNGTTRRDKLEQYIKILEMQNTGTKRKLDQLKIELNKEKEKEYNGKEQTRP